MKRLAILLVFVALMSSCRKTSEGFFYISNGSLDKKGVKLTVLVDSDTIFNQIANYTNVAPDLQYIENKTLTQEPHVVKVISEEENLIKTDTITFDSDKWIFISFVFEAPPDSSEREAFRRKILLQNPELKELMPKGRKAELIIHTMHQQPIHQ